MPFKRKEYCLDLTKRLIADWKIMTKIVGDKYNLECNITGR